MIKRPCRERRFPLSPSLCASLVETDYTCWMRSLIERLGEKPARHVWQVAFDTYDVSTLEEILSYGWFSARGGRECTGRDADSAVAADNASSSDETRGIPPAHTLLIHAAPPLPQLRSVLSTGDVKRDSLVCEAIHIRTHGVALLCEALIDIYGKQGEFIAYDTQVTIRSRRAANPGGTVEEFIKACDREPDPPDIHAAGLEAERIRVTDTEHVTRVTECEWARYLSERHPRVGYLVACSTDAAGARAFNDRLRLQRTSTLMEGGDACDFRYYALSEGG